MRTFAPLLAFCLALSGCAGATDDAPDPSDPFHGDAGPFMVPPMRVGDRLTYDFAFGATGGRTFSGATTFIVVGPATIRDGYGHMSSTIHLRQSNADGSFAEDYYVDAKSFKQLQLVRRDTYNETATLQAPPPAPLPTKRSYANATGVLERYALDPLFEDANMFGVFATGRELPSDGTFNVTGNLWQRNGTRQLRSSVVEGPVTVAAPHERWGELRTLAFSERYRQSETYFEDVTWSGDFSPTVPFAVRADRAIQADFFGDVYDVRFTLTLTDYSPGSGEPLARGEEAGSHVGPAGERAAAPRFPSDGDGDKLLFPLSEAITALERDPTATQFFQNHPGSYLYFAEMVDIHTCAFYPPGASPPACHWLQWNGVFFAPDDWILTFWVEKYANDDGTGAAYAPVIARDDILELAFSVQAGDPTIEPTPAIEASNAGVDLSERSAYPADALTIAGAIDRWKQGASDPNSRQDANRLEVHLTPQGYEFFVAYIQWEFPPENPELFPFYDNMPFELRRHTAAIQPDGFVVEHRNYEVTTEHR